MRLWDLLRPRKKGKINMKNSIKIKRLVGISTLCAIAFVLQFWISGVIPKLPIGGGTAINLALIPVVVGAILYGPEGGLSVGIFLGAVTLLPGQGAEGFYVNWYMTILAIVLCLLKTGLAGFVSGWLFRLFSKKNFIVGIFAASMIAPIVNSGTFLLLYGILIFIMTGEAYGVTFVATAAAIWIAFLVELALNIILAPTIASVVKILAKNHSLGFSNDFSKIISEENVEEIEAI